MTASRPRFRRPARAVVAAALVALAAPVAAETVAVHDGRLFVAARLNGQPVEGLLDSGAEMTVVDRQFARSVGIGAGEAAEMRGTGKGTQAAELVEGVAIDALDTRLDAVKVAVVDLGDVSARVIKRPTRLILGRDLFDARRIRIDLARREVHALGAGEAPAGTPLALTAMEGIEAIPVTVMGMAAKALIDFGNGSEPLVSRPLADALGLAPAGSRIGGGIGGAHEQALVTIPEMVIAGERFTNVLAAVDERARSMQLNIGTSILSRFVVTTDYAGRRAWFAPARALASGAGR